ncbi:MAG: T9SS type A sorting domain-containing protein [Saprospiraceae bacterium]|nr:T9SS type A sorting domain-containing protein [Saprospiraceae bacterium]
MSCGPLDYWGTTLGYGPSSAPGFCGTPTNSQWLAFVAGAAQANVVLAPDNCQLGDGLQLAVYDQYPVAAPPIACAPGMAGGGSTNLDLPVQMLPGKTYFILVDGYNGDQCDFQLTVFPPAASMAPPVGNTGAMQGASTICPGGTVTYSLPGNVSGAGYYRWEAPPGSLINGMPGPATIPAPAGRLADITFGPSSGQVRVTPFNACDEGPVASRFVSVVPIPPTVLPPKYVCPGDFPYLLPWGDIAPAAGTYQTVYTSWQGCDSIVRQQLILLNACDASGTVFADFNANGQFDGNDTGLGNTLVRASSGTFVTTSPDGAYAFASLPVGDTIWPEINFAGAVLTPPFYLNQPGNETGLDFAVSASFGPPDVAVYINAAGPFRPGFGSTIYATAKNTSLGAQANVVLKVLLPPFLNLQSAAPAADYVLNDTLFWEVDTLHPGAAFQAKLEVLTPVSTPLGASVEVWTQVCPLNDLDPLNNTKTYRRLVVGSYDPNDKLVEPAYLTPAMLAARNRLEYTIRFQNTGNYPADFVKIIDTVQAGLEPTSFQLLASSHPCTWKVQKPGVIEFLFADINLPDSTSNEPESHGFVHFSLRPKQGLAVGYQLENFCDIYFDFNPPVRTNTAGTHVVTFLPGEPPTGNTMDARPNPAVYSLQLGWAMPLPQPGLLHLYTLTGLPVLEKNVPSGSTGIELYVADLPSGVYLAVLEVGNQRFVKQVVVQRPGGPVRKAPRY